MEYAWGLPSVFCLYNCMRNIIYKTIFLLIYNFCVIKITNFLSQNYKYFIDHQSLLENGCLDGMFVTTVFLLDTSASMTGTGLEQMKTAFKNIIYGNRNSLSNQT